jgi:hypothetical protein
MRRIIEPKLLINPEWNEMLNYLFRLMNISLKPIHKSYPQNRIVNQISNLHLNARCFLYNWNIFIQFFVKH